MKKRCISAVAVIALMIFCFKVGYDNTAVTEADELIEVQTDGTLEDNTTKDEPIKVKGIFVSGPMGGSEGMDNIISLINDTELNTIVLDVKDDCGNVSFKMDNQNVIDTGACIPYIQDIDTFLKTLKDNDIYVIARIPCFKDPVLAKARPDLALIDDQGNPITDAGGNAWVNPCKEEVWNYIISIAETCCELGFDEIQLDYVRFPVGQNAANALYGAPTDDAHRQEYINRFLGQVTERIHPYNVPVAADVFGTIIKSSEDAAHVGQDYVNLSKSLDIVCPMIYPSHYANGEYGIEIPDAEPYKTILSALKSSKDVLSTVPDSQCAVIRPWLQGFTATWIEGSIEYGKDAVNQQIQAVYDAGYEEWIIWNSKCQYDYFR